MANLQFCGMFDYSTGDSDIYKYTSAEFSKLIKGLTQNGISSTFGDSFEITASGLTLTAGSGCVFIEGRYGYNDNDTTIVLDAETVSLQRIDRIVLELNTVNRTIELKVVKGTAAGTATVPELTQNSLTYQLPLYKVLITNGSTTTLTDERTLVYSPTEINEKLERILSGTDLVYAVYA
jgi:hypothetical protein